MKSPKVFLIVLNHNGLDLLPACFDSIRKLAYDNLQTVMVDNASTDGSCARIRRDYPEVFLIQNPNNDGFSSGMNLGIRHALERGAEYVALLNNDTEVDPGWISELVKIAAPNSSIGAVASRMMYLANRRVINGLGVSMSLLAYCWDRFQGRIFRPEMDRSEEVFSVCGGACLLSADALRGTGLLDPGYIFYLEDVDLCVRMRERGYQTVTAPRAVIHHKSSASFGLGSPRQIHHILRSRLRFILKYFPVRMIPHVLLHIYRHERLEARRFRRAGAWALPAAQVKAVCGALVSAAGIARFRAASRGRFGPRVIEKLAPVYRPEVPPPIRWDFRAPAEGDALPARIIMGVSDGILGDGWYTLEGKEPRYRWTTDRAECFLRAARGMPHILQLHLRQPFKPHKDCRIRVTEGDRRLAHFAVPAGDWHTVRIECTPASDRVRITLEVDELLPIEETGGARDLGFQCNEVSLLPAGSPFLRRDTRSAPLAAPGFPPSDLLTSP